MFSSLPSASKIYVSSCKPRQKVVSSAKKKRKKSSAANSICTPVPVCDEETLISSTSLRKCSDAQQSVKSFHESIEDEVIPKSDQEVLNSGSESTDNSYDHAKIVKFRRTKRTGKTTEIEVDRVKMPPTSITHNSQSLTSDVKKDVTEQCTAESKISDSIYCDESCETVVPRLKEETQEGLVKVPEGISESSVHKTNEECDSVCENKECDETPSLLPAAELNEERDGVCENKECDETSSLLSATELNEERDSMCENKKCDETPSLLPAAGCTTEEMDVQTDGESLYNEDPSHNEAVVNSVHVDRDELDLKYAAKENFPKDLSVLNVEKNTQKEGGGDADSSSSDCCPSTNIYDIHIVHSDPSSGDENQAFVREECRLQSPQQSETSCTESVMYDIKHASQDELLPRQSSDTDKACKNHPVLNSCDNCSRTDSSRGKSNDCCSFTAFQNLPKSNSLRRSVSLPDKLHSFKVFSHELDENAVETQQSNINRFVAASSKFCSTSDKSTFTVDNFFTSNKSTITSDIVSPIHVKKDVATTPVKDGNEVLTTENKSVATSFKDNTMLIMKVLPPVAIMQARARSYMFGNIGSTASLLGIDELSRFFPDNKVTVFVGTWNMNGHDPPECIDDFLLPLDVSSVPDIYAVGIQESMHSRSEWEVLLQTTLGPSHVLFASTSFGVLHLSIFMRRDLIWFCSEPEEANIATRPGSMIKTKGAVAICFMFFGTSFLFVNSHLTAHEQKLKERLSDYEKICSALDLPKQIPLKPFQKGKDVTSRFDCVFWCGDLNFRVVQDRPSVMSFVEEKIRSHERSCNILMKHDQLTQAMAKGVAFHGFNEGVINFIPSYKFDVGTSCFDSVKQRVPSYTDRILYRSRDKSSIVCSHYNAVPEIFTSDHKPVFAIFNVSIKPGRDNIPLAAGLFKRDIYVEAIKRRAQQLEVTRNHKQSTICNVM